MRNHQIQVSIAIKRPKKHLITKQLLLQALYYRATTEQNPPGMQIKTIVWDTGKREYIYDEHNDITEALNQAIRMGLEFHFQVI